MEVFCTVGVFRKEGQAPSTEKVFLGRLSEALVASYLTQNKSFQILAQNLHLGWGEIDLLVENTQQKERWIVEVRGKRNFSLVPVEWVTQAKIRRLQNLAHVLTERSGLVHRILFIQVHLKEILEKPNETQVRAFLEEFEVEGY